MISDRCLPTTPGRTHLGSHRVERAEGQLAAEVTEGLVTMVGRSYLAGARPNELGALGLMGWGFGSRVGRRAAGLRPSNQGAWWCVLTPTPITHSNGGRCPALHVPAWRPCILLDECAATARPGQDECSVGHASWGLLSFAVGSVVADRLLEFSSQREPRGYAERRRARRAGACLQGGAAVNGQ